MRNMLSEETIGEIVKGKIERDESLGEQVGGSGHLGYKSYKIDYISEPEKTQTPNKELFKITYKYTIYIETEFTYYPDNPPHEYKSRKTIFIDRKGNIVNESPKEALWNDSREVDKLQDF